MAKGSKKKEAGKQAVKAAKKQKQVKKQEQKGKKKTKADGVAAGVDEEDLIATLEDFQRKWEEDHKLTEDVVEGPPSRRANASLTADPTNPFIWLFGGEFFDGTSAFFYNDFYRFNTEKNEWRRLSSPTFPGPRSAHQMVASPAGGGKLWLFGGEFASVNQSSFHHYRDLWCFDITTQAWDRIDTKIKPSARSGHRMTMWKQWIILFGGFHDVGIRTNYLNDLWIFDTLEYRWSQVIPKDQDRWPSARSGFSLLSTSEGIILHGGYSKKYLSKTKWEGVPHDDTFLAKLDGLNDDRGISGKGWSTIKWEKRKRVGQVPSLRSGSTMVLWANRGLAIGFGGVHDVEDEENLTSEFYNDLYAYQLTGNGRWMALNLKKKKKAGAKRRKKVEVAAQPVDSDDDHDDHDELEPPVQTRRVEPNAQRNDDEDSDPDDPEKTIPLERYNAMLVVLRNTLYLYGGIYEQGDRDFTLASFYSLALDKMDRYQCLREDDLGTHDWVESESESGSDDESEGSDDESSDDEAEEDEETTEKKEKVEEVEIVNGKEEEELDDRTELRKQAEAFMGVSRSTERQMDDVMSTPLPGENLKSFYDRSREYWTQKAHEGSDLRGKELRRDGFAIAEERFLEYKPLLEEIERIQEEAGIDAADVQRRLAPGASGPGAESRHRR